MPITPQNCLLWRILSKASVIFVFYISLALCYSLSLFISISLPVLSPYFSLSLSYFSFLTASLSLSLSLLISLFMIVFLLLDLSTIIYLDKLSNPWSLTRYKSLFFHWLCSVHCSSLPIEDGVREQIEGVPHRWLCCGDLLCHRCHRNLCHPPGGATICGTSSSAGEQWTKPMQGYSLKARIRVMNYFVVMKIHSYHNLELFKCTVVN